MANAESPGLRKKVADLRSSTTEDVNSDAEMTIRGIEKGAWDVLLKNIKTPTLKPKPTTRQQSPGRPELARSCDRGKKRPILLLEDLSKPPSKPDRQEQPRTLELWSNTELPGIEPPVSYTPCTSPVPYQQFSPYFTPPVTSYCNRPSSPLPLHWPQFPMAPIPNTYPQGWQQPMNGFLPTFHSIAHPQELYNMGWTGQTQQASAAGDTGIYNSDEWMYGNMGEGSKWLQQEGI